MLRSFDARGQMSLSEERSHTHLSFFLVMTTHCELLRFLASNKKWQEVCGRLNMKGVE
jgi:hypothetical protein